MSRRLLSLLIAAVILTLLLSWPVWRYAGSTVAGDIGDPLLNTWILAWDAHALLRGTNVWDANMYYPLRGVLAYTEHLLGPAVLSLPLQLISEPLPAYNLTLLASFPLAFLAAYLLALHLWRRHWAALVAGAAFAFGPYRFALLSHLQLLEGQWLPFAILMLDRYMRLPGRWRLVAAFVFLLLQVSVGWYMAVFSMVAVAAWVAISLATGRWQLRRRHGPLALLAICLGTALLILAMPYTKALPALQQQRQLTEATSFSFRPVDTLIAAPGNWLWGKVSAPLRSSPGYNGEHALYLGWAAMVAAGVGAALALRSRHDRKACLAVLGIVLVCLVLAVGPSTYLGGREVSLPWRWLVAVVPPLQGLRVPARWFVPASLGMAVLASRSVGSRRTGLALAALCLLDGLSLPLPVAQVGSLTEQPSVYRLLDRPEEAGAVIELPLWVGPQPEYLEAKRLYRSTMHWQPLVNGYSGLTPDRQLGLAQEFAAFPEERSLLALRGLAQEGVAHLIVHPGEGALDAGQWEQQGRWRLAREPMLRLEAVSPAAWLYRLYPDGDWEMLPFLAQFDNGITLIGYHWDEVGAFAPTLTLFWQCLRPPGRDWTAFVHLTDANGVIIAQADGDPVNGHFPTGDWRLGDIVRDEHIFAQGVSGGSAFVVGWYDRTSGQRSTIVSGGDHVVLPLPAAGKR
ncbi:MAG: hypothetical protein ACUVWR_10135 [Anaerolineae bacterium]